MNLRINDPFIVAYIAELERRHPANGYKHVPIHSSQYRATNTVVVGKGVFELIMSEQSWIKQYVHRVFHNGRWKYRLLRNEVIVDPKADPYSIRVEYRG